MTEQRAREILHMELYGAPYLKIYDGWMALSFCQYKEDEKVLQDVRLSESSEGLPKAVRVEYRVSRDKEMAKFLREQVEIMELRAEALDTLLSLGYTFV